MRSIELFVFSLSAIPIELNSIENSIVSTELFHQNIVFLAKLKDASEASKQVFLTSRFLGRYAGCKAEVDRIATTLHRGQSDEGTTSAIVDLEANLKDKCRAEYVRAMGAGDRMTSSAVNEDTNAELSARIVQEVLVRDIYKKQFHPLLKSMCDAHIFFPICSYDYGSLVYSISMNVELDKMSYQKMANILGLSRDEFEEGGLPEGNEDVDVWPIYTGRCAPDPTPPDGGACW